MVVSSWLCKKNRLWFCPALPPPGRVTLTKSIQHKHEPLILTCICLGGQVAGHGTWLPEPNSLTKCQTHSDAQRPRSPPCSRSLCSQQPDLCKSLHASTIWSWALKAAACLSTGKKDGEQARDSQDHRGQRPSDVYCPVETVQRSSICL